MKMLDLYKSILKAAGYTVTEDNYISRVLPDGKVTPATIKGKRMVLPTQEHLSNPADKVVFHPLSENVLRGESAVLEEFRRSMNIRLNVAIGLIAYQLLRIASSTAIHSQLSPDQQDFLSKVKHADERSLEDFRKTMKAMDLTQTQKAFVGIYLKRGGIVNGKKYGRAGVVSFPLYEELTKGSHEVYGVKLRVKDIATFKALFEYMIPNIDKKEAHNRGSDSDVAPYLDSLMKAVMTIAAPINDLVELFRNQLDDPKAEDGDGAEKVTETLRFEDSWVETFENLAVLVPEIRQVPMQAGNEGQPSKTGVTTPVATTTPAPHQMATPLPAALMSPQGFQPAPPVWANVAQQVSTGPVVTARGGLDFDSVLRSNPALAQATGGFVGGFQQPQQQRAGFSQPQAGGWNQQQQGWNQPQQQQFGGGGFRSSGI
jgi:hypothetical protein